MSLISARDAFNEGSELWIIPDRKNSYWARRIDWHIQFLISRSMVHQKPEVSESLKRIVKENEIDNSVGEISKAAPLLIFSVDLLPNRETVHLPCGTSFKSWVEKAHQIWHDLKKPSVRVFLPRSQDYEEFRKYWHDISNLSVVIDAGGH